MYVVTHKEILLFVQCYSPDGFIKINVSAIISVVVYCPFCWSSLEGAGDSSDECLMLKSKHYY